MTHVAVIGSAIAAALAEAGVPVIETLRPGSSWAGHYEYNTFDQSALTGILPQAPNLVFANGFSGHGMQQSPGVGHAAAGRPVLERNII